MKKFVKGFGIVIVLLFGFSLVLFSNRISGWRAFNVMSASMEPAIPTGSVIITQYAHPSILSEKDIITFIAPVKERILVTHRIVEVEHKDNLSIFKTKGDNNKSEDKWTLAGGGVIGKMVYFVPYLGYFMSFAQSKIGILIFILLPAVYIVIDEIFSVFHLVKRHRKKKAMDNTVLTVLLFLSGVFFHSILSTYALLSDAVVLSNNVFAVSLIEPTISPTPSVTITPTFPSCTDPKGTIISSYDTGLHEIVGVGLLRGSDVVYQLSEGSKDRVLQCYCSESGVGIQTNWLKTSEVEKYKDLGWPFSIDSGVGWNLDEGAYVARNLEYACGLSGGN